MQINRREFLKLVEIGAGAVVSWNPLHAFSVQDKFKPATIEDKISLINFNPEFAANVRTLVQLVASNEDYPLSYNTGLSNPLEKIVDVKLETEGKVYYVTVMLSDKTRNLKRRDKIMIKYGNSGAKEKDFIIVWDIGLDGRCDQGKIQDQKQWKKHKVYADFDINSPEPAASLTLPMQPIFQPKYENAVYALLRFYQQPKKK